MAIIAWLARSQLGGYTGDVLGAVQQTADVFILFVIGAMLP
jgi:cobalamin synthase